MTRARRASFSSRIHDRRILAAFGLVFEPVAGNFARLRSVEAMDRERLKSECVDRLAEFLFQGADSPEHHSALEVWASRENELRSL